MFESYFKAIDGRPNTKGGHYRVNLLPTTVHVYFGSVLGATPDGRKAGKALSEGISPVQGMDVRGNVTSMVLGNGVEAYATYQAHSGRIEVLEAYDAQGVRIYEVVVG